MHFTATTVFRVKNGKIAEEVGLDDGGTAIQQLGILKECMKRRLPKGPRLDTAGPARRVCLGLAQTRTRRRLCQSGILLCRTRTTRHAVTKELRAIRYRALNARQIIACERLVRPGARYDRDERPHISSAMTYRHTCAQASVRATMPACRTLREVCAKYAGATERRAGRVAEAVLAFASESRRACHCDRTYAGGGK
jgi:hypothetical protein